jgi:integrase
MASILAPHLERFAGVGRDGLVFPNTAGNPLAESSFYVHHFKKAQVACGIKLRFHDLRHTSVALTRRCSTDSERGRGRHRGRMMGN